MNDLAVWAQFIRRPDWFDQAACQDLPPAMFFTHNHTHSDRDDTVEEAAAKQVCADCPVRVDCLAVGLHERFGIWGGRTPRERSRLRRLTRSSVA